jgi:hypothetical protein
MWITRALVHGALALVWVTVLGGMVIWPRWNAWQSARSSLQVQTELYRELSERQRFLETTQREHEAWSTGERRALLAAEVPAFLAEVRRLLKPTGAQILRLQTGGLPAAPVTGPVQPLPVILELQGDFKAIYRSVARLEGQRFLALVRTAEMTRFAEGDPRLRAVLRCDLFVLQAEGRDRLAVARTARGA